MQPAGERCWKRASANGWSADEKGARVADALLSAEDRSELQKKGRRVSGVTFDAGGLIALDRNDRRVLALVARATELGMRITIPATALARPFVVPHGRPASAG